MKLSFYGAAKNVTGSCYLLDTGHEKILVDCGLFQGSKELKERNYRGFPFEPSSVDYLLLTHAHTDHSGLIPKLMLEGFKGQILATIPTVDLCAIMLPDSGHIQEKEVERKNRKAKRSGSPLLSPIYTASDGAEAIKFFRPVIYGETIQLTSNLRIRFQEAGHILGSACLEIWYEDVNEKTKIVFSGDLGRENAPIVNDPTAIYEADYVVVESTYGDRLHDQFASRKEILKQMLWSTYHDRGKLLIPSFAIERTQDLLYELAQLYQDGEMPPLDIYLDSPLAIAATEVFSRNIYYFDREAKDFFHNSRGMFSLPNLRYSRSTDESMAINELEGPAVIIAGSGMADAGRIKHHLKHHLWKSNTTVMFVGYQAEGTLGRRLLDGEKKVKIHGEEVIVGAKIVSIPGFSAHADQQGLLSWLSHFDKDRLKQVFITHGEASVMDVFSQVVKEKLSFDSYVPDYMETVQLAPGYYQQISTKGCAQTEDDTISEVKKKYHAVRLLLRELVEEQGDQEQFGLLLAHLSQLETQLKGFISQKD